MLLTETASSDAEEKAAATPSEPSSIEEEDEPSEEEQEETRAVPVDTGEDEGDTSGAESETEARIKLIAGGEPTLSAIRRQQTREALAAQAPRLEPVGGRGGPEGDPAGPRGVLRVRRYPVRRRRRAESAQEGGRDGQKGELLFYFSYARAMSTDGVFCLQDLRLAVAGGGGDRPRPETARVQPGPRVRRSAEDDGDDDGDDRVRVVGISEGIPPEDRIATGSRDGAFLFIFVRAIGLMMSCFVNRPDGCQV